MFRQRRPVDQCQKCPLENKAQLVEHLPPTQVKVRAVGWGHSSPYHETEQEQLSPKRLEPVQAYDSGNPGTDEDQATYEGHRGGHSR
jgi:hypothetical protein